MRKKNPALEKDVKESKHLLKHLFSIKLVRVVVSVVAFLILAPFILFFILKPVPAEQINYGVTFSKKYSEQLGQEWKSAFLKTVDELKVKNMRLVVYWDDVERVKDKYDYSDIKWQLTEAEKRDIKVILSMGLKVPRYPECFSPDWWKKITNKTQKDNELYEYVKQTATELKSFQNIIIWQVENEPFWPFGECEKGDREVVLNEISVVRSIDPRPILVQDSGEGGFWAPTYQMGDYLGISMYRKIWYDFWGLFMGKFIYFQYPLAHWSYKIKANLVGVPVNNIIITELQAEPWGPGINSSLSKEEKDKTMSRSDFIDTLNYAQKSGFKDLYLWGVEWWLWEKEVKNTPFYWDTAKALFQ
jgi:hypothetical protein